MLHLVELKRSVTWDGEVGLDPVPVRPVPGILQAEVAPISLSKKMVADLFVLSKD